MLCYNSEDISLAKTVFILTSFRENEHVLGLILREAGEAGAPRNLWKLVEKACVCVCEIEQRDNDE